MKKCTSYLACMSVVITCLAASNSVDAGIFSSFKNSKSEVADKKDRGAFDALQTIADTKIDKGLGKLLQNRDKIDQEIMKKVGKLDVGQYRVVDMFLEELAANSLVAIAVANKTNDVNGKIMCINYISKLYMFAQNKKWNEFKHCLTEFGNVTFSSGNLNNLKNDILSGINNLFMKYFSPNEMNASDVVHVKSQPKILAIEDKKDNIDSSIMLDDTVYDPVRKSHRPTFNDMKGYAKQMRSGDRNVKIQIGDHSNKNTDQLINLDSFLNDGDNVGEIIEGPFNVEYVDSPQATYSISNISGEKEQVAQEQADVEQNVDGPFFVETINKSNPEYLVEELPVRNESSANDSVEGVNVKQKIKLLDEQLSRMKVGNPTT